MLGNTVICNDDNGLSEFTKRQLIAYYVENTLESARVENGIRCGGDNLYSLFCELVSNDCIRSRDFCISDKKILYRNYEYICNQDEVCINRISKSSFLYKYGKKLNGIRLALKREKLYAYNHLRFYNEVLFPLFSLYSIMGFFLLHGSIACNAMGKSIAILGLDGVGKSTISLLLQEQGWECYSDNFILTNGLKYVPLNLTARIDTKQRISIPAIYEDKELKEINNKKTLNRLIIPDEVYCLYMNSEIKRECVSSDFLSLLLYCNGANEIKEANSFCAPFHLLNSSAINEVKTILLGIPRGKLKEGCEIIINGN